VHVLAGHGLQSFLACAKDQCKRRKKTGRTDGRPEALKSAMDDYGDLRGVRDGGQLQILDLRPISQCEDLITELTSSEWP
jgi:hypothetical protein